MAFDLRLSPGVVGGSDSKYLSINSEHTEVVDRRSSSRSAAESTALGS